MSIGLKKILSEISAGELLDKLTILEIKREKIKEKSSQAEIIKEYKVLKEVQKKNIEINEELKKLIEELKIVNLNLWDVEDKLRICEKNKNFDEAFIQLARDVYFNNDKRSKIKSKINETLGSNIKEVKKYASY
tara:strand:+ start:492 stop:893 length:402 start_codon:yes stop_codon:yes gene_type:complete